jgi:hypothetical protein
MWKYKVQLCPMRIWTLRNLNLIPILWAYIPKLVELLQEKVREGDNGHIGAVKCIVLHPIVYSFKKERVATVHPRLATSEQSHDLELGGGTNRRLNHEGVCELSHIPIGDLYSDYTTSFSYFWKANTYHDNVHTNRASLDVYATIRGDKLRCTHRECNDQSVGAGLHSRNQDAVLGWYPDKRMYKRWDYRWPRMSELCRRSSKG